MDQLTTKELALYRLKSARERFLVAQQLFDLGHYMDAASRAYYAIFQAARAVLATVELDSRKHSGSSAYLTSILLKQAFYRRNFARS